MKTTIDRLMDHGHLTPLRRMRDELYGAIMNEIIDECHEDSLKQCLVGETGAFRSFFGMRDEWESDDHETFYIVCETIKRLEREQYEAAMARKEVEA